MGGGPPDMMQLVLDLTDKQNAVVQEILAGNQKAVAAIFEKSGLNHGDMRLLHGINDKFKQQSMAALASVLDEEQLRILRKNPVDGAPFDCIVLSEKEQLSLLQNSLKLSKEQVGQVSAVIAEEVAKYDIVLDTLGFNVAQLTALQDVLAARRAEMTKSLEAVLSKEQLAKFEKIHIRMAKRNPGPGPGPKPMKGGKRL